MQATLGGFDGAHGGIKAAHHEFAEGLTPLKADFTQNLDPLVDDGFIGACSPEAERRQSNHVFQLRRYTEKRL